MQLFHVADYHAAETNQRRPAQSVVSKLRRDFQAARERCFYAVKEFQAGGSGAKLLNGETIEV